MSEVDDERVFNDPQKNSWLKAKKWKDVDKSDIFKYQKALLPISDETGQRYTQWGSGSEEYSGTFGVELQKIVSGLRKKKERIVGLDLMGSGRPLLDLGIVGYFVILKATVFREPPGINGTEDDVRNDSVWEKIKQHGPYDLILCRPGGAMEIFNHGPLLFTMTLRKMYRNLASGGRLFTQVPVQMNDLFKEWIEEKIQPLGMGDYHLNSSRKDPSMSSIHLQKKESSMDLAADVKILNEDCALIYQSSVIDKGEH